MHTLSSIRACVVGCFLYAACCIATCAGAAQTTAPIATVLGQPVIAAPSGDVSEQLRQAILTPLLLRFAEQNKLVATQAEIAEVAAQFKPAAAGRSHTSPGAATAEGRAHGAVAQGSAAASAVVSAGDLRNASNIDATTWVWATVVIDWKVSQALYRKYGGDVLFQQSNPLEPVGALGQFLLAEERSGAFTIADGATREAFYAYFLHPRGHIVPPVQVNYDLPWWRQRASAR